jgi:hypothetical protein
MIIAAPPATTVIMTLGGRGSTPKVMITWSGRLDRG